MGPPALLRVLSFVLPLLGAVFMTRGDALFRSDRAILAALDGGPAFAGALSRSLAQLFIKLPLGNLSFRMALIGAVALGLIGLFSLHLSYLLFRKQGGYSRLDPWLAWGASLAAALSLATASEGTVAGGATVAVALSLLFFVQLLKNGAPRTHGEAWLRGLLAGLVFSESLWCGAVLLFATLVLWPMPTHPGRVTLRSSWEKVQQQARGPLLILGSLIAASLLTTAVLWAPNAQALSHSLFSHNELISKWPAYSPLNWLSSVGYLWCLGAIVAVLFALKDRRPLLLLCSAVILDWLVPSFGEQGWTEFSQNDSNRSALHLLAFACVATMGALGLRTLGESAHALGLFGARQLSTLISVIAVAGSFAGAEDSLRTLSQTETQAAQAWTDEALEGLPAGTLVLTHSSVQGARLLAAQASGSRPDVLVVPLSELLDPRRINDWLKKEPALDLLLRDLSLNETPSERALTRLVDTRPVAVEANPAWDSRILEQVAPSLPLSRLSAHALGRSDRIEALDRSLSSLKRIDSYSKQGLRPDQATGGIFEQDQKNLSDVLARIDSGAAKHFEEQQQLINPPPASDAAQADEEMRSGKKLAAR